MNATLLLVCMAGSLSAGQEPEVVFRAPKIEVLHGQDFGKRRLAFSYLMYNRVYLGRNYHPPKDRADGGNPDADYRRLPTTYFHDKSPIGVVLQRYNWFPTRTNEYHADARLPASMAGMGMFPLAGIVNLWSEPPVAMLGMDVGTLASYARPTQVFHFTERVPVFVKLSLPEEKETRYFHYVQDALDRGACLKIFEGEPRDMLEKHGGAGFYQLIVINTYKLPVVGVHKELMTKEALGMLLGKLRDGGIVCFHTSNRYYDLAPILLNAAAELNCATVVSHDDGSAMRDDPDHRFSSEWVMIARKKEDLAHLKEPPGYNPPDYVGRRPFWSRDERPGKKILWTDAGENAFRGVYRSDPGIDLLGDSVNRFIWWSGERIGLPGHSLQSKMRPVQAGFRAWSRSSAESMNRELPKKNLTDESKE